MPILRLRLRWLPVLTCGLGSLLAASAAVGAEDSASDFFERKVRPLLVEHCFSCHARGQKKGGPQTEEGRKFGESLAPQIAKYVAGAWTLQNRRRGEAKVATSKVADELGLNEFVLDRWVQFLSMDNVRQRATLAPLKPLFEQQSGKGDLSDDVVARSAIEAAAMTLQEQLLGALRTRDEQEAEHARKVAEAAEAEKSKVAKPKLEQPLANLIKDLLTDNKAPLLIPKDRLDKLLPDASKELPASDSPSNWAKLRCVPIQRPGIAAMSPKNTGANMPVCSRDLINFPQGDLGNSSRAAIRLSSPR